MLRQAGVSRVIDGQRTAWRDVSRFILLDFVTVSEDGHAAFARCHDRRDNLGTILVFHQHVMRGENVTRASWE